MNAYLSPKILLKQSTKIHLSKTITKELHTVYFTEAVLCPLLFYCLFVIVCFFWKMAIKWTKEGRSCLKTKPLSVCFFVLFSFHNSTVLQIIQNCIKIISKKSKTRWMEVVIYTVWITSLNSLWDKAKVKFSIMARYTPVLSLGNMWLSTMSIICLHDAKVINQKKKKILYVLYPNKWKPYKSKLA